MWGFVRSGIKSPALHPRRDPHKVPSGMAWQARAGLVAGILCSVYLTCTVPRQHSTAQQSTELHRALRHGVISLILFFIPVSIPGWLVP
jgi:hypothetical protein